MEVIPLQSGSNGNSYYVHAGSRKFLFDAGITGSTASTRLASQGRDINQVEALFISHSHRDHCQSMGIFQRKFGPTIFITETTLRSARANHRQGILKDLNFFAAGQSVDFGDVRVHTIPTPHDAADSVAFVIETSDCRLGILTDMGHAFSGLKQVIEQLDAVIIESNYDPRMLEASGYPAWLKQRVRGPGGHLANEEAANEIHQAGTTNLQWICLCHLSKENNDPQVAVDTHRQILSDPVPVHVSSRYEVGKRMLIEKNGQLQPWKPVMQSSGRPKQSDQQLHLFS